MYTDLRNHHQELLKTLQQDLRGNSEPLRIKKKTTSNLFRYDGRRKAAAREADLSHFNKPLFLDEKSMTLEVQGLSTFEQIVDFVLPKGFLPLITPELKHITIGGATVGIGIESNTYRYGFVHNSLLEADVLLSDGSVITCSPKNQYKDLFLALPNSYGTLGYVLRAKIKLRKVLPYMTLSTTRFDDTLSLINGLKSTVTDSSIDSIESLVYSKNELYMTTVKQAQQPVNLISIYGDTVFYKEISKPGKFSLFTRDFIFRYDPEWFWNMPDAGLFKVFRKIAPQAIRNSGFYTRYGQRIADFFTNQNEAPPVEQLIQDWEVPWKHAESLLNFVLKTVDLLGRPLLLSPIQVPDSATLYPMKKNQLYLNLGSYSFVKKSAGKEAYFNTKQIDKFCFAHAGIKMLYSSTFLEESEFDRIYNGSAYKKLKKKYDKRGLLPTLFEKTVKSH